MPENEQKKPLTEAELDERRNRRPENYAELPAAERKKIDEQLGLIDEESGIPLL